MNGFEQFLGNARSRGILIDTNLLVLLIVGYVDQNRIKLFKRTRNYSAEDWETLTGILEYAPRQYSIPHIFSEASNLTDLKGPKREEARAILHNAIARMEEVPLASLDACRSPYYRRLGLTDAAILLVVKERGCSVVTSDTALYLALLEDGASVVNFDDLRRIL